MHTTHKFIKTSEIDRNKYQNLEHKIMGAVVVCAECGEVREVWEDGKVNILIKGKWPLTSQSKK